MKCFYDITQDAVGTCKSCGKGLSAEYAVDLGKGLACRNKCEEDVAALIALIDNNVAMRATTQKIIQGSGRAGMIGSVLYLLMGGVFLVTGIIMSPRGIFLVILGALFILWSLFALVRSYSIQRTIAESARRKE
jgi:hypothetical protein